MSLKAYLDGMVRLRKISQQAPPEGYAYRCMEEYVLQNGEFYESQPLTDDELKWLFEIIGTQRFAVKQCYYNSQILLMNTVFLDNRHELRYVEGYAMGIIPIPHGWLTLNGKVVDLTMRLRENLKRKSPVNRKRLMDRALGEFPEEFEYCGVTFETKHVQQEIVRTGLARTLIDDWENQWPLLKIA